MESLLNLESFVQSADGGSFSAAARRLSLTPAAVSRNVAALEQNLGVRLFHRSTRRLTLTEAGEHFLLAIRNDLNSLQSAISSISSHQNEPAGTLKVSVSPTFGMEYILPLLPEFLSVYPKIKPDWQFDNRPVDLIADGFDAAIGGGFDLPSGIISRILAPAHIIAVASTGYMKHRPLPATPTDLSGFDGVVMRAARTGRIRQWTMRNAAGDEQLVFLRETVIVNDPAAMCKAAVLGLGVALIAVPDALPYLQRGELIRLAPLWYADAGPISLYFANKTLLPAKTRAFIDFVSDHFRHYHLAEKFAGSLGPHSYK